MVQLSLRLRGEAEAGSNLKNGIASPPCED